MYTKYISYWKRALFAATAMTLAFTASPVFADEDEDEVEEEVLDDFERRLRRIRRNS